MRGGGPLQEAHGLCIGVLLDHGQIGVQADAHCGIKGHLEGSPVVLGANHGPQLLAVNRLLDLLEEPLKGLPVVVGLELHTSNSRAHQRGIQIVAQQLPFCCLLDLLEEPLAGV